MAVDNVKVAAAAIPIWNCIGLEPLVVDIDWMFFEFRTLANRCSRGLAFGSEALPG
jgi:hypothetical protein